MAKRNLMLLLGSICILLIVAGYAASNWGTDITDTTPETITADNSTIGDDADTTPATSTNTTSTSSNTTTAETPENNNDNPEGNETGDSSAVTTITLNKDSISVDNENGVTIDKTTATITSAGTYNISGTLDDGQIIVDTNDEEAVRLVLNGVEISSTTNAPIYVEDANKTVIVLADGTENYLTDNKNNEDNATLCSRDDLTISGDGALTVCGNVNDAIRSNDGLIIESGTITVTSVDDGIRGKDYLVIKGGTITVNSVGDGLKSDNDEEENKGYISIENSTIDITSTKGDAITAQTDLVITDGAFTLTSGGGSDATLNETVSTKGLKAGANIVIDGGVFSISSSDDAIHSNGKIVINDGTYDIASVDDGVHADTSLEINGGTIDITKSYEGMESAAITISNGSIQVDSSEDGISGKDYLVIMDGDITVSSVGDGLKSDNNEDASKGYVSIEGGTIQVTATQGDAITAQTDLSITDGTFTLTSGGGSDAMLNDLLSTKGLKAGASIVIDYGDFTINASDDAVHSNGVITINSGTFDIASGDDGIHADTSLEINGGTLDVSQSFEGMESAVVTINDGYIHIDSSDDGINLAGGNDDNTQNGGRPQGGGFPGGGGGFEAAGEYYLYIRGGFIAIDSGGDGVDSNGYIEMSDGVLIINGPTSNMNAAIDYGGGSFTLTGGTLVAIGSAGMAQAPSASSTQYSANLRFSSLQSANVLVNIQTASGEDLLTFCPTKTYQSLVFSSPELAAGSYDVYVGGNSTGTLSYGLYEDGTYSPGTKYGSFTLS